MAIVIPVLDRASGRENPPGCRLNVISECHFTSEQASRMKKGRELHSACVSPKLLFLHQVGGGTDTAKTRNLGDLLRTKCKGLTEERKGGA